MRAALETMGVDDAKKKFPAPPEPTPTPTPSDTPPPRPDRYHADPGPGGQRHTRPAEPHPDQHPRADGPTTDLASPSRGAAPLLMAVATPPKPWARTRAAIAAALVRRLL